MKPKNKSEITSIIHFVADDGFYCPERDRGIIQGMKIFRIHHDHGITDCSILCNGKGAQRDGELYKFLTEINHIPGLHFNLTEGPPISSPEKVPTLVNSNGEFHGKHGLRKRIENNQISKDDVVLEINEQLNKFNLLFNSIPSHFDGHQHIHIVPFIAEIIGPILCNMKIKHMRIPVENYLEFPKDSMNNVRESLEFYETISKQSKFCRNEKLFGDDFENYRFIGMNLMGSYMTHERLRRSLESAIVKGKSLIIEIMCHPGFRSQPKDSRSGYNNGPDEFSQSNERENELKVLCDQKEIVKILHDFNIRLSAFN